MTHTSEMKALLYHPRGRFSRKTCDSYWAVIRYYLSVKVKVDETLQEDLDDLLYEYT
jgi:hypothetical protein